MTSRRFRVPVLLFGLLLSAVIVTAQPAEVTPEATADPAACSEPALNIVTTVGMVADLVENIGASCVSVSTMMGAGVDPHLYSATERDVETLFEADLIFYGGLNLEARLTDIFDQIHTGLNKPVIAVSAAIPEELVLREAGTTATDPHVWMDVTLWQIAAGAVLEGLTAALPDHAPYFDANAEVYFEEMEALDAYIREQIAGIPEEQRVLVTAHDAFQYFSRAYGIEVYAPQGITTQAEVGVQDIRATIDLLVERQIPAIFVETSVSPDVVEAIQAGAQARGLDVQIGGSLFSDSMGDAGTEQGTYLGMIRHNVDTIVAALRGE